MELELGRGRSRAGSDAGFLAMAERCGAEPRRRVLLWQGLRSLMRLAASAALALCVGRWIMGIEPSAAAFGVLAAALLGAAGAGLMAEGGEARGEAKVATALRRRVGEDLIAMPGRAVGTISPGALVAGLQRHPDALATLVVGHRVARNMTVVGPLFAALALVAMSWQAALTVIVLTPVMILFFALVGEAIRVRAEARERAFARLAGQFADRIRGLPTILANHALHAEAEKLDARLEAHRSRTMGVLRIAFLNAGVIDFFSSLSIAILAVFLGLGHLGLATIPGFSGLELWQSLFVLMVAPEYFAAFRRYAEQYHARADGLAAATALDDLMRPAAAPSAAERPEPPDVVLPKRGLVVLCGPSGAGKSTLLRRLAGLEAGPHGPRPGLSWIASDVFVPEGTLAEAIAWKAPLREQAWLLRAAGMIGLLDDSLLPGGLDARIEPGGTNLSGGQRLRIAVARALLGDGIVFADEPTAKLDISTAGLVRDALRDMAATRLVVVASHDPALIRMARQRVELGRSSASSEIEIS